ncbi:hypothetical protein FACS1894181_11380 [Bacteroidia bacterium]|nr:hypothetical protein FACS1894181_11380 [Bacteroidia bacterium]
MEDIPISNISFVTLAADYLLIWDSKALTEFAHVFDKKNFKYLTSVIPKGEGPGEVARIGHIAVDEACRKLYVTDLAKYRVFEYCIDSLLANPDYMPEAEIKMEQALFPWKYQFINDTLGIGVIIKPIGNANFNQSAAGWNMKTGEVYPLKYERLDNVVEKRMLSVAVSTGHGLIAKTYHNYDLMTICTLDGDLKYNIYGANWKRSEGSNRITFYGDAAFCGDRIFALYLGGDAYSKERQEVFYPTMFHIFDLDGNYIKTLETGYNITGFCYDKDNNRLIMAMNDDIQFGYLDLAGLVE